MTKRLIVAVFLVLALVSASFATSSQRCSMMPSEATATSCGCCATMKSCVVTQEQPIQSAATAQATQQPAAIMAPVLHELFAPAVASHSRPGEIASVQPAVHAPARLALLCTFLI